ncbi:LOW QUALITY PROTEIN: hypothetical protein PHMEG_0006584 [Phytophthora megakarya]|uniref:Uncharacterized protein n=1 Tax=Phytophthora megakarya TaxID=4795 RepID=A0A225WQB7_9STRA|nr:LOW QUALITY PROTEIN: hypothetical protein PHMEG_0006584 [Phytophthora megakarya]
MFMANAYLTHKEGGKIKGTVAMKRYEWFSVLYNQLPNSKPKILLAPPPTIYKRQRTPVRLTHALQKSEGWVTVSGVQKHRQR